MSSSFGTLFRVATFGESHGVGVGAVVDGCPPNLELSEAELLRAIADTLDCPIPPFVEIAESSEHDHE